MSHTEPIARVVETGEIEDVLAARALGVAANEAAQLGNTEESRDILAEARARFPSVDLLHPYAAAEAFIAIHEQGDLLFAHEILRQAMRERSAAEDGDVLNEILASQIICAHLSGHPEWWDDAVSFASANSALVDPVIAYTLEAHLHIRPTASGRVDHALVERSVRIGQAWKHTILFVAAALVRWEEDEAAFVARLSNARNVGDGPLEMDALAFEVSRRKAAMWGETSVELKKSLAAVADKPLVYATARTHSLVALSDAYLGDEKSARHHEAIASAWALPRGLRLILLDLWQVNAVLYLSTSRFEDGYATMTAVDGDTERWATSGLGASELLALAEACERVGRPGDAVPALEAAIKFGIDSQSPHQAMMLRAASAIVEPDVDRAEELFESSLALGGDINSPFNTARIRLTYARFLFERRSDSMRARAEVGRAAFDFDRLGTKLYHERALRELNEFSGLSAHRRARTTAQLSRQEQQVVQLAAEGLSNKAIGRRLFISSRTVGYHLYNAFPKLGVSSRAGLRDALLGRMDDAS
jgi:DNA-binding CsgD family transcriptional regulator